MCAQAAPALQQRVSQRLSHLSSLPEVQQNAKGVLRREARELHGLKHVPSADLLPSLKCMLSVGRGGGESCTEAERDALAGVGVSLPPKE